MESKQLDFLDESGKSIIERIATFLAVLFGAVAFGSSFHPEYLISNPSINYHIIIILLCYLIAVALGIFAMQPRSYTWHCYQTKEMAETLNSIIARKKRLVQWAGLLFALGTVMLAAVIVSLIWDV